MYFKVIADVKKFSISNIYDGRTDAKVSLPLKYEEIISFFKYVPISLIFCHGYLNLKFGYLLIII